MRSSRRNKGCGFLDVENVKFQALLELTDRDIFACALSCHEFLCGNSAGFPQQVSGFS